MSESEESEATGDRYVAFLRAINVGGRRLKNDELRGHFATIGFDDVAAFRASGNVIFAAADGGRDELAERIESGLGDALGYEVQPFIRDANEIRAIASHEHFDPEAVERSEGRLQVTMLAAEPAADAREAALAMASDDDLLAIGARELYWLPSAGTLDSNLDHRGLERLLGVGTMRTMGTVEAIADKYFAPE